MSLYKGLLHLIGHQSSNGPANLMILWPFSQGAKQDEKKPVQHKTPVKSFSNEVFRDLSADQS